MNAAELTLKVLVAVILLAGAPLALKRRWRLFLAIPLAVFQGFVPWSKVASVPIPLAFWGGLMLWPELIRESRRVLTWKPTAYVLGIVILYIVSFLWSPDRKLGLQPIGYFLQFLVIFAAVLSETRRDEKAVFRLLTVTLAFGLVQALTVVIFRLLPGLKLEFYLSPIAKWFISPNSLKLMFIKGQNNVLDPTKSGGMFGLDADICAPFLGILVFIAAGLALRFRSRWQMITGLLLLSAIAFVGSKAGLMLAVALPVLALHAISWQFRRWRNVLRLAMLAFVLVGTVAWFLPKAIEASQATGYQALSSLLEQSQATLTTREKIWAFTPQVFVQHPFRGQGFGGWEKSILPYARKVGLSEGHFPPHNTIIYLWSQGGLLAALLGLGFMYQVMRLGWDQMRRPNGHAFGLSLAMSFGFLWTFVQGMGENYGLLGDVHMSPLLACLLALGYMQRDATLVPVVDARPDEYRGLSLVPAAGPRIQPE